MLTQTTEESSGAARPARDRQHQRHELDMRVAVRVPGNGARPLLGRTLDISAGGIAILLTHEVPAQAMVELEFTLPATSEPLRVTAVLRNRDRYRHGFEFQAISARQRLAIEKACAWMGALR